MSNLTVSLSVIDGHPTTTSLQIAEHFNKRHDHVLQSIRGLCLELSDADRLPNFRETVTERPNPSGGEAIRTPAYIVSRDGFTLLAMGFTGKKALQWKLAYIKAFNAMETALHSNSTLISPAQAQELRELVQLIAASGKQGHGETWNRLHRKMGVNSYLNLPASRFVEAREYLRGKMDGQALDDLARKHFPELAKYDAFGLLEEAVEHAQAVVASLGVELGRYRHLAQSQLAAPVR